LETINLLRKTAYHEKALIWKRVRELLYRPKRRRIAVNISKLNRYTKEGDTVVVPGKILGSGYIDHKIKVAAYDFSLSARKKLKDAGCEILTIKELLSENPRGREVKIIV
jgi:large subunit ribosomal protein L18e